jgi:hypothetical protein
MFWMVAFWVVAFWVVAWVRIPTPSSWRPTAGHPRLRAHRKKTGCKNVPLPVRRQAGSANVVDIIRDVAPSPADRRSWDPQRYEKINHGQ